MGEWRDISTAPKDGTPVVLFRPPSNYGILDTVVVARWVESHNGDVIAAWCWPANACDIFDDEMFSQAVSDDEVYEDAKRFTHWMPLPESPS